MSKRNRFTEEDDALLAELGIQIESKRAVKHTALEERIIAAFEEIQNFVDEHGHLPKHGEEKDIFERLYAIRLDQIRKNENYQKILKDFDHQNLLEEELDNDSGELEDLDDDELLAKLGVDQDEENSITNLKYVRSRAKKKRQRRSQIVLHVEILKNMNPYLRK